jgi:hypothetical protein
MDKRNLEDPLRSRRQSKPRPNLVATDSLSSPDNIRALKRQLSSVDFYYSDVKMNQDVIDNVGAQGVLRRQTTVKVDLLGAFGDIVGLARLRKLKWNENNVAQLITLFSKTSVLAEQLECQFGHCSTFCSNVRACDFFTVISAPQKERPGSFLYDQIMLMFTHMMKTFYAVYWRKPLETKPFFYTSNCDFQDPFFRQNVRHRNLEDPDIDKLFFNEEFNLKEFVLAALKMFFPHEATVWAKDKHEAHIYTLRLFLEMFEYGLWTAKEVESLNEILHSLVLAMTVYDRTLSTQLNNTRSDADYLNRYLRNLGLIKRLIGHTYIHMVLLMLDNHVEGALYNFGIEFGNKNVQSFDIVPDVPLNELFDYQRLKNKLFYTYFGYVISTYLMKPTGLSGKVCDSPGLYAMQKKLLGFMTNPAIDFYYHSLQTMDPNNFTFYLSGKNNEPVRAAKGIQDRIQNFFTNLDEAFLNDGEGMSAMTLSNLFDDIIDLFYKYRQSSELASYQTALAMYGVPKDLMYILYYMVSYEVGRAGVRSIMNHCVRALAEIISNNTLAMSILTSGLSFLHFKQYMAVDRVGGLVLLGEMFLSEYGILMADVNDKIFQFALDNYSELSKKFADCLKRGTQGVIQGMDFEEICSFLSFQKLFKGIFKHKRSHRLKLEILYMTSEAETAKAFIQWFANRSVPEGYHATGPNGTESLFAKCLTWADVTDPRLREYIIDEAAHQALATFQHSTKNFHYEQIQQSYFRFFTTDCRLMSFSRAIQSHRGLSIFKNIVKVYSSFMVFNRNATFYHTSFANKGGDIHTGAYLSSEDIQFKVLDEIEALFNHIRPLAEDGFQGDDNTIFMNVYFPLYFKFLAGFLTLARDRVLEAIPQETLARVQTFIQGQTRFLETLHERAPATELPKVNEYYVNFIKLLNDASDDFLLKKTPRRKIKNLRDECKNSMRAFLELTLKYPHHSPETEELIRSLSFEHKTDVTSKLYRKLDMQGKFRLKNDLPDEEPIKWEEAEEKLKEELLKHPRGQFDLQGLRDHQLESPYLFFIKRSGKPRYSGTETEMSDEDIVEGRRFPPVPNSRSTLASFYILQRYKRYRGFLMDNFKKNKMLYVINIQDAHTQNVQNVVSFVFTKLAKLDVSFDARKVKHNFFVDNFYMYLIFLMDVMMQNGPLFREKLYEFASNPDYKAVVGPAFEKIWVLNKSLFSYLVYKSFLDETWIGLFRDFYLVSVFIQNLCEENFVPFKDWFRHTSLNPKSSISALEEFHGLIEDALLNNEVFASNDNQLAIQDREEMFPIFCRAIECLTEFINGGICESAEDLYYKRMDIFVGMFFRVIDDLDSFFYELKDNVIVYVSALIEHNNPTVIEFVARNFSVTRIFGLLRTLIKKLYVCQRQKLRELASQKGDGKKVEVLGYKQEQEDIPNDEVLLDYYKLYEEEFAEHQLIGICIKLFVFMNNVAKHVSRYSHFVEELDLNSKNPEKLSYSSPVILTHRESAIVWSFLKKITVKIEIQWPDPEEIEEMNSDAGPGLRSRNTINYQGKNESRLMNIEEVKGVRSRATESPILRLIDPKPIEKESQGKLENYIFQKKPVSFFVNSEMQKKFLKEVKISSLEEKHSDFAGIFEVYDKRAERLWTYYRHNKFLYYFNEPKLQRVYRFTLMVISLVINLLLLIFYNNTTENYKMWRFGNGYALVTIFAFIGVALAGTLLIIWSIGNYKANVEETLTYYRIKKHIKAHDLSFFQKVNAHLLRPLLFHPDFIFYALKLAFYLLGWFINPIFYSLAMFLVIELSETIKGVTMCFVNNSSKLGIGMLLIMMCINVFAYILFDKYPDYFKFKPVNTGMCSTYFKCFLNVMNQGMINDQGIANVMTHVSLSSNSHFMGRFFLDVVYFIFITILLFDIIFGMVVDSYEEFKEDLREREHDRDNVCFVCGLNKETIEKYNLRFDDHQRFHNKWNYFYYYQFLQRFPSNDYNGVDIYVSDLLDNSQLTWMPEGRTQAIEALQHFGKFKAV